MAVLEVEEAAEVQAPARVQEPREHQPVVRVLQLGSVEHDARHPDHGDQRQEGRQRLAAEGMSGRGGIFAALRLADLAGYSAALFESCSIGPEGMNWANREMPGWDVSPERSPVKEISADFASATEG